MPWRTGMPGRPDLPMPLLRRGRPLKRWRWVGAFGEDVLLCAAVARIGPAPVSWWAVWDRGSGSLAERTVKRTGPVRFEEARVIVDDGPVRVDLGLDPGQAVETISDHGGQPIWTRKTPVRVTGSVVVGGRRRTVDAPGLIDDSAGYHARHTAWWWSAGAGRTDDGRPVTWNLVDGLHDAPEASERTVWVDGIPHHVERQAFDGLHGVGGLRFTAEATRAHAEDLLVVASDYEQPFGTFSGELPVAGRITGLGVMERHRARW